ncbi:hypothetical protein [Kribbella capetownensis]|uniref:hypothetical protein n=1 Tax=Kribbella capetownensis TaxID=1572659 RepID=UPI00192D497B|nr:hypothetical protein [Kribbella capetownensis]
MGVDRVADIWGERSPRARDTAWPMGDGFSTRGQLFLEDYYTLAVIGMAGLGTPHMDRDHRAFAEPLPHQYEDREIPPAA